MPCKFTTFPQKKMPSSPAELLQLSKELFALKKDETWQRCVVSRAYYSTLHATDATFPRTERSVRIDGESSHAEIIGRAVVYGKSLQPGRSNANQIAQALPRLRRFRNLADYRLEEALSEREYSDVLLRAERVLNLCADVERLRSAVVVVDSPEVDDVLPAAAAVAREAAKTEAGPQPSKPSLKRIK